ncbi:NAD(P)H-dependent oxidoreductase [Brevibacterium sp. GP-SGM9]|uniref:NAD(P)H-dependent oxidoreductase n=1 Tax=Brevibacterium sp. GP-SGM9 TaxID=3376990 RepID=UPI0039A6ED5F
MSTRTITVLAVTTSLSEDSSTLKLSDRILAEAVSAGESTGVTVRTETINIRSLASALTDMALTGFRSEALDEAYSRVAAADAIVTVTPVYKVAPVGLHTLFWQLIDEKSLVGKAVLIASTGGTPRHSQAGETALRPMLSYLKGIVVPTTVFAATDDWGSIEGGRSLTARVRQAGEELIGLAGDLSGIAGASGPARADAASTSTGEFGRATGRRAPSIDEEFDPERITPFAQLLEG